MNVFQQFLDAGLVCQHAFQKQRLLELAHNFTNNPKDFEYTSKVENQFQKILDLVTVYQLIVDVYAHCPWSLQSRLIERYHTLLAQEESLQQLEVLYRLHQSYEVFEKLISQQYVLLLDQLFEKRPSLDFLQDRYQLCPPNARATIMKRYTQLLELIHSYEMLNAFYFRCPDDFVPLFLQRCTALIRLNLQKAKSVIEVESKVNVVPYWAMGIAHSILQELAQKSS